MNLKKRCECFESYPAWMIALSTLVSLAIYAIGAYIIYQLGIIFLGVYVLYILALQIKLMKKSCVNCYYYGKYCAFGIGKLAKLFFKKRDSKRFSEKQVGWKDIFSDFLIPLIPMVAGIVLLVSNFNLALLLLLILLVLLSFFGNGLVRSSLSCRHCKQRELGCPAEKLFKKCQKKN